MAQQVMRVAVVTGGNRGIGLGVCRELAKLPNMVVILTSRSEADGRAAVASLEGAGQVEYHQLDVSSDESVAKFKTNVETAHGRVDVLVNNAGNFLRGTPLTLAPKELNDMFNVHVTASMRMIQVCLPLMKKHGFGRIINMSSGLGQTGVMSSGGLPGTCGYGVVKMALHALTIMAAGEVTPDEDIHVNAITPGFVRTEMSIQAGVPLELPEKVGARWRAPEEIGQDIVRLINQPKDGPRGKLLHQGKEQPW